MFINLQLNQMKYLIVIDVSNYILCHTNNQPWGFSALCYNFRPTYEAHTHADVSSSQLESSLFVRRPTGSFVDCWFPHRSASRHWPHPPFGPLCTNHFDFTWVPRHAAALMSLGSHALGHHIPDSCASITIHFVLFVFSISRICIV